MIKTNWHLPLQASWKENKESHRVSGLCTTRATTNVTKGQGAGEEGEEGTQ